MKVSVFSQGKQPPKNEDAYAYNETSFVVCDGCTSKRGGLFENKTGGELASNFMVEEAMRSKLNGSALVEHLSSLLLKKRNEAKAAGYDVEMETTLLCARIAGAKLIVTQIADTSFRLNQEKLFVNPAIIDIVSSQARAHYIQLTKDYDGSRDYIQPLLLAERDYSNNALSPAGYGVLNGGVVPAKFIKTYEFDISDVSRLEIYTDGYYAIPPTASIAAYEELYTKIEREDPYKCLNYPATKPKDDRTVMIVAFDV